MKSAIGGLASGLASGLQIGDEMQGRAEDRELRSRVEDRQQRLSAITEEKGQMELAQARHNQAYQQSAEALTKKWMEEKDPEGNPLAWDAKRDMAFWDARVKHDLGWNKISAADQRQFAEAKKKYGEENITKAFNKLAVKDYKGAQPFLDEMGLATADLVQKPDKSWVIKGSNKAGDPVEVPMAFVAGIVNAPELPKALAGEADLRLKDAQTAAYQGHGRLYDTQAETMKYEKHLIQLNNGLRNTFSDDRRAVSQLALEIEKHDKAIDANPNLSDEQKAAQKKTMDGKRTTLAERSQRLERDFNDTGTIVDNARELGVTVSVPTARKYLEEAAKGSENIIINKDDGRAYYRMPGVRGKEKYIPLPSGSVPQAVYDKWSQKTGETIPRPTGTPLPGQQPGAAGSTAAPVAPGAPAGPPAAGPAPAQPSPLGGQGAAAAAAPAAARTAAPAADVRASVAPTRDTSVTIPGMGSVKKSAIPALKEQFYAAFREAARTGDKQQQAQISKALGLIAEAEKSPGI